MIEVRHLSLGHESFSLKEISFKVEKGKYSVLMGPTGSGKTSLLEAIVGLKPIHSGQVFLNGEEVTHLGPACREIGYMPQEPSLFKTMNVKANLAFALEVRNVEKKKVKERVIELAELFGVTHLLDRLPQGLSGGEQQRVTLGRALAFEPEILILDEPFSAVDEKTSQGLCELLKEIQVSKGMTMLHVSHHPREAEYLADNILYLSDGALAEKTP